MSTPPPPSSGKRAKDILVLNPEQRDILASSPARLEIIDAMSVIEPCSIAELAIELDRSPQSLYYHIDIMVNAGMLEQAGTRKTGRREEALYQMVGRGFRMADTSAIDAREAVVKYTSTVLRLTDRNNRAAFENDLVRKIDDQMENIYTRRQRGWLTDDDLRRIYRHIDAIGRIIRRGNRRKKGQMYAFTSVVAPLGKPKE